MMEYFEVFRNGEKIADLSSDGSFEMTPKEICEAFAKDEYGYDVEVREKENAG